MKLQLTVPQLESLLTEEIKVELTNGVLAGFSERIKDRVIAKLNNMHKVVIEQAAAEALKNTKLFEVSGYRQVLTQDSKNLIKQQVVDAFNTEVREQVKAIAQELKENIDKSIERTFGNYIDSVTFTNKVKSMLEAEALNMIKTHLKTISLKDLMK